MKISIWSSDWHGQWTPKLFGSELPDFVLDFSESFIVYFNHILRDSNTILSGHPRWYVAVFLTQTLRSLSTDYFTGKRSSWIKYLGFGEGAAATLLLLYWFSIPWPWPWGDCLCEFGADVAWVVEEGSEGMNTVYPAGVGVALEVLFDPPPAGIRW